MINNYYNIGDKVIAKINYANSSEKEVKATIIGIEFDEITSKTRYKIIFNSDNVECEGYVYEDSIKSEEDPIDMKNSKYLIIWRCVYESDDERVRVTYISAGSSQEAIEIFKKKIYNKLFQITIVAVEKLAS